MNIILVIGLFVISSVSSWSTLDRTDKTHVINFYEKSNLRLQACRDKLDSQICKKYKPYCFRNAKLTKLCRKTCVDCVAVSPLSCHASEYGCCWDNVTKSDGRNGEGCPVCRDRSEKCRKVISQCDLHHVQKSCPVTCQIDGCVDRNCRDDRTQLEHCGQFRAAGFCESEINLMKQFCKRTCNLCEKKEKKTNGVAQSDDIDGLDQIIETLKNADQSNIKTVNKVDDTLDTKVNIKSSDDEAKKGSNEVSGDMKPEEIRKLSDAALLSLIVTELKKRESTIIKDLKGKSDIAKNKENEKTQAKNKKEQVKRAKQNKAEEVLLALILENAESLKSKV